MTIVKRKDELCIFFGVPLLPARKNAGLKVAGSGYLSRSMLRLYISLTQNSPRRAKARRAACQIFTLC